MFSDTGYINIKSLWKAYEDENVNIMQILISSIIPNSPWALHSFPVIADRLITQSRTPFNKMQQLKHSLSLVLCWHCQHGGTVVLIKLLSHRGTWFATHVSAGT